MEEALTHCSTYAKPNTFQACVSLLLTCGLECGAVVLIYSPFSLLGWILHTLTLIRVFVQFHDMAHSSFFPSIQLNTFFGELLGLYLVYPFHAWKLGHNHHHQHFGILLGEDTSQTILFTKREYEQYNLPTRCLIRILRDPYIFFPITVPFLWIFGTLFLYVARIRESPSNVLTKCVGLLLLYWFASTPYLVCYYLSVVIGAVLFHLQHSVNLPYRKTKEHWNRNSAALEGSTLLHVPGFLKPFTNGIEYHHIHHLHTLVPSYAIQDCHDHFPNWQACGICEVDSDLAWESLSNVMYEEETGLLVPFDPLFGKN
jgi:omega-6 fatty acid desaturase (delta-12 desaturase)